MDKRWQPGDVVIERNCGFFRGEAWGTPYLVVRDTDELVVLYRPEGTRAQVWDLDEPRLSELRPARMDMLRLMYPGRYYAVELFFDTGRGVPPYDHFQGEARFRAWKVNIEAPFRRCELGFDTTDHFLDIIVKPDRAFYWKDHEAVAAWTERGAYTKDEVERLYAAGRETEPLIEAGLSPFDEEWTDWRPDGDRSPPQAPPGWQLLPGIDLTLARPPLRRLAAAA